MRISREDMLADCSRMLDEGADLEACRQRYPEISEVLKGDLALQSRLADVRAPLPLEAQTGRRLVLTALAEKRPAQGRLGFQPLRLAGVLAGLALVGASVVGAGASPVIPSAVGGLPDQAMQQIQKVSRGKPANVPPPHSQGAAKQNGEASIVPQQLGDGGEHGAAVSEGVRQAIESTDPGPERGQAVRQAACEAAHDRSTLPAPAQQAPGLENKPDRDHCTFEEQGSTSIQQGPPAEPGQGNRPGNVPPVTPGEGGPPSGVPPAVGQQSQLDAGPPSNPGQGGPPPGRGNR
jgi:hypothetical protein